MGTFIRFFESPPAPEQRQCASSGLTRAATPLRARSIPHIAGHAAPRVSERGKPEGERTHAPRAQRRDDGGLGRLVADLDDHRQRVELAAVWKSSDTIGISSGGVASSSATARLGALPSYLRFQSSIREVAQQRRIEAPARRRAGRDEQDGDPARGLRRRSSSPVSTPSPRNGRRPTPERGRCSWDRCTRSRAPGARGSCLQRRTRRDSASHRASSNPRSCSASSTAS